MTRLSSFEIQEQVYCCGGLAPLRLEYSLPRANSNHRRGNCSISHIEGIIMDRISIPEEQIVPMQDVADGIRGLRIAFVNIFAVSHADGSWTLIDAGLPYTATMIRRWAEK